MTYSGQKWLPNTCKFLQSASNLPAYHITITKKTTCMLYKKKYNSIPHHNRILTFELSQKCQNRPTLLYLLCQPLFMSFLTNTSRISNEILIEKKIIPNALKKTNFWNKNLSFFHKFLKLNKKKFWSILGTDSFLYFPSFFTAITCHV
jgi:hypothetical protein